MVAGESDAGGAKVKCSRCALSRLDVNHRLYHDYTEDCVRGDYMATGDINVHAKEFNGYRDPDDGTWRYRCLCISCHKQRLVEQLELAMIENPEQRDFWAEELERAIKDQSL